MHAVDSRTLSETGCSKI